MGTGVCAGADIDTENPDVIRRFFDGAEQISGLLCLCRCDIEHLPDELRAQRCETACKTDPERYEIGVENRPTLPNM
jgi:hypothetical protein